MGFGWVTLGANPYALVEIDGQRVGTTPIVRHRLAAGRHEVVFIAPDSGAVRRRVPFSIEADETREIVVP